MAPTSNASVAEAEVVPEDVVVETEVSAEPTPTRRRAPHVDVALGFDAVVDLARATSSAGYKLFLEQVFQSPLYHLTLRGPMPDHIIRAPQELRPGKARMGTQLLNGQYAFAGDTLQCSDQNPFAARQISPAWAAELHGFAWLRHLAAGENTEKRARSLVDAWYDSAGGWDTIAWRPDVIARRLMSWMAHSKYLFNGADIKWQSDFIRRMARQARHLNRTAAIATPGEQRMTAAVGLALSGLCLSEGARRAQKGLKLVERELDRQILSDGGHISRCPSIHLSILLDLITLRQVLANTNTQCPDKIQHAIDRMTPMLRFFRHGDGRLGLFNGATEEENGAADAVLSRDEINAAPLMHARHSGYQRIKAGKTTALIDTGAPPRGRFSQRMHAGCLSFELSAGPHRIVVNCGDARDHGRDWRIACRATAAHSTLTVDDTSSAAFLWGRFWTGLLGERLIAGPSNVTADRDEEEGATWISASHDGYLENFGLTHERRLYMDGAGDDFRGEDNLLRSAVTQDELLETREFTVRFHLHPDIRVSLARDEQSVLLLLPNGDGWRFRAAGGVVALGESIYLGKPGAMRKSTQIVVSGSTVGRAQEAASVKWAFHRLKSAASKPAKRKKNQKAQAEPA